MKVYPFHTGSQLAIGNLQLATGNLQLAAGNQQLAIGNLLQSIHFSNQVLLLFDHLPVASFQPPVAYLQTIIHLS